MPWIYLCIYSARGFYYSIRRDTATAYLLVPNSYHHRNCLCQHYTATTYEWLRELRTKQLLPVLGHELLLPCIMQSRVCSSGTHTSQITMSDGGWHGYS